MKIHVDIDLPSSPDEVWSYVSDLASHTDWMADAARIDFVDEQREGVGTTFDCLTEVGPFRTVDRMEITLWEPGQRMGVGHSGVVTGSGEFTLTPIGDPPGSETRFGWTEELRLPWFFGGRIGEIFAAPILRFIWRRNLRGLRARVLERQRQAEGLGDLIGKGRNSEVRARSDKEVVRIAMGDADLGHEAEATAFVRRAGYPAPAVIERTDAGSIVMERLNGPTMLEDLISRPWMLPGHARTLARLHRQLSAIDAPAHWLQVSDGASVVHLDLNPDNVKLTPAGPVVIDWSRAARGSGDFDAAFTYVVLRTGETGAGPAGRVVVASLRNRFAAAFLRRYGAADVRPHIRAAAELRLLDPSLTAGQRERVFALARGELD